MGNNIAPSAFVVPEDNDLGPQMRECTTAEREFIVALFQTGARNYTEAAMLTGRYANRESANAAAARWMSKPRVLLGLDEYTRITMKQGLPVATVALLEIARDPMHKDRMKAAIELLNRNGHLVETVSRHIIEDNRDTSEIVKIAIQYARQLGDERLAYKLLGNSVPKDVIDAKFEEVDELGDLLA